MPKRPPMTQTTPQNAPDWRSIPVKNRVEVAANALFRAYGAFVYERRIAMQAHTNEVTLCKYTSAQKLLVQYIHSMRKDADQVWQEAAQDDPNDPLAQLRSWLGVASSFSNAWFDSHRQLMRIEEQLWTPLRNKPPVIGFIEDWRRADHYKILQLCRKAGLRNPEMLADKLMMMVDGARSARSAFDYDPAVLDAAAETLLLSHGAQPAREDRD